MSQNRVLLALDVGEKRIGIAAADAAVPIARPLGVVEVDGREAQRILQHISDEKADTLIVGYPRNQSGEPTAQTAYVESFVRRLSGETTLPIIFQDESLTSVLAEERLRTYGKPYTKGDVDAQAATMILQDYLESSNGRI